MNISGCASVEPWNQVVQMSGKPGCASVVYNYIVNKDFRLCSSRILKSNFTDVVKVRLWECSVQWYLRKDFRLRRCKPLKSFSERVKTSGWMGVALNNLSVPILGCTGVVQHMLNIVDEQQILVGYVDVI